MLKAICGIVFFFLAAGCAPAQQELAPSMSDGPMNIKPAPPRPDADGVYSPRPGIVTPIVLQRAQVVYPAGAAADTIEGESVVSLVVGIDGTASDIHVVRTHGSSFDDAAVAAVRQSRFDPGTIDGKPVPVRIFARTRFYTDLRPTYPRTLIRYPQVLAPFAHPPMRLMRGDSSPTPINTAEPEYSDEARRKGIEGVVIVSVLVTEEGIPIDPRVEKSLDASLDDKAVECALNYRFRPAIRNGVPTAQRIQIEMSFKLH